MLNKDITQFLKDLLAKTSIKVALIGICLAILITPMYSSLVNQLETIKDSTEKLKSVEENTKSLKELKNNFKLQEDKISKIESKQIESNAKLDFIIVMIKEKNSTIGGK